VDRPPDELVVLAQGGDRDAYAELVRRHQQLAFRVAYLIVGSAADAEDAVQEAFVKAFDALDRFRRDAPFRPWLLRIVGNEARNLRRAAGRRLHYETRAAHEAASGGAVPSPEAAAESEDVRLRLVAAVNELPPRDRLIVGLRYFLDLSEEETARAAGIPRGTVKSRLWRARRRLRTVLEDADVR
jgi:RNA polymerase sigma-70 factor (ECF subfamily)